MNKKQKAILMNFATVIVVTAIAVAAMINFRDWVNHSEAMRAMEHLGLIALQYRKDRGMVPPESYVENIREDLEGHVRLGDLQYRARWIDFECPSDTILAYSQRNYSSFFFDDGYIVLRLSGDVEWMGKKEFEELLAQQQSPMEIQEMLK
jgi:hypothetical protein